MRKFYTVAFSFLLIFSLTACNNKYETVNNSEKKVIVNNAKQTVSENNTETISDSSIKKESSEEGYEIKVLPEKAYTETNTNDTIWVNKRANIRTGPDTSFDILDIGEYGESYSRIAVLSNGWSKIKFNDDIAFINSSLIQTDEIIITKSETVGVSVTGSYCTGIAKEIFEATNVERINAGLSPLTWSDELAAAANVRATELVVSFSHTRPDGSYFNTVSRLAGGENVLRGPAMTGQEMVTAWMNSEGHRENLLYPSFTKIGVSTFSCDQGMTGCQLFGY